MKSRREAEQVPTAGSPAPGEPVFLAVGKLRRPHGVHGEILMEILTDFPERLKAGSQLFVGPMHQPHTIKSYRQHNDGLLVSFEGYHSPEEVGVLRNQYVFVSSSDRPPLPDGEYYHHQLIGLSVMEENGNLLGNIAAILETGANDVLVVHPDSGPEILLPLIDEVVLDINLAQAEVRVHLLPGLRSEE